jgi:CheY-like chemotaxis protein
VQGLNIGERRSGAVTRLTEQEVLIKHAAGLARRSAWHAKQSADLADEAEALLIEAETLRDESCSSATPLRTTAQSLVPVSRNQTVLIVDDDTFVTETFARTLKLEGYDVLTACTAAGAVAAAAVRRPDLILLDLHLPCTDGVTLLREFRSVPDHRVTPVAVITGDYFVADDVTRELIQLGAYLHFKPIWTDDLITLTHSMLQRLPN